MNIEKEANRLKKVYNVWLSINSLNLSLYLSYTKSINCKKIVVHVEVISAWAKKLEFDLYNDRWAQKNKFAKKG
jgi:hypothetical protein